MSWLSAIRDLRYVTFKRTKKAVQIHQIFLCLIISCYIFILSSVEERDAGKQ